MAQQVPGPTNSGVSGAAPRGARLSGGVIAMIAGGGLLLAFMVQNRENVTLQFLWWTLNVPLWLFTLLVAALGAVVWIGVGVLRRHRRRVARRNARDD